MIDFKLIPPGSVIIHRTKRRAFVPWAIRAWTKGWSNHTSIYFGSGRHEIIEAAFPRVQRNTLDAYYNDQCAFRVYFKSNLSVLQLAGIKGYAYGCLGKRYDLQGLFSFVFGWKDNAHQNFCSELVAECFDRAMIYVGGSEPGKLSPADLERYFTSPEGRQQGWAKIMEWNA